MIALHFATDDLNKYDKDGAVWKINYSDAHEMLQDKEKKFWQNLEPKYSMWILYIVLLKIYKHWIVYMQNHMM